MKVNLSIVIPLYNERDNVAALHAKITASAQALSDIADYEIILVDDRSVDGSFEACAAIKDPHVRPLCLPAHAGQTHALQTGFQAARYDLILTLDADLQNDPADLPLMLGELGKGFDFVQGWRESRQDPWIRKASSILANSFRRWVLKDFFHDMGCSLRLFKKECLSGIELFEGAHRFLPYLVQQNGFKVTECRVHHHPRIAGVSKYNVHNRLFKSLGDLVRVRLKKRPGRV